MVHWEVGTLEITGTQKVFIRSMLNRFRVNSSSDIFAIPGVKLGPRAEDEPREIDRTRRLWAA